MDNRAHQRSVALGIQSTEQMLKVRSEDRTLANQLECSKGSSTPLLPTTHWRLLFGLAWACSKAVFVS